MIDGVEHSIRILTALIIEGTSIVQNRHQHILWICSVDAGVGSTETLDPLPGNLTGRGLLFWIRCSVRIDVKKPPG